MEGLKFEQRSTDYLHVTVPDSVDEQELVELIAEADQRWQGARLKHGIELDIITFGEMMDSVDFVNVSRATTECLMETEAEVTRLKDSAFVPDGVFFYRDSK